MKKLLSYFKFFIIYLLIILYSLELFTTIFLGKKHDLPSKNLNQLRFEKSPNKENFDRRDRLRAFIEEKKKYPELSPVYRYSQSQWHLFRQNKKIQNFLKKKINNEEIIPFRGPINKKTLGCNEDGLRRIINNDKFGFQNTNDVYLKVIDIMIIGDSFAEGACFTEQDDIAGRIRKKTSLNAINYGISGTGPLLNLAVLIEYGSALKPKDVFYLFYEGNDMDDLMAERKTFLVNYLNDYRQNLFQNQKNIKLFLDDFENIVYEIMQYKNFNDLDLNKTNKIQNETNNKKYIEYLKDFFELTSLRDILFPKSFHSSKKKEDINLLSLVLSKMKKITNSWNGKLHIVYVPSWNRYNSKYSLANYNYKKKIKKLIISNNIKFIDLVEVFKKQSVDDPINLYNLGLFGHFNTRGYEIISNTIIQNTNKELN